MSQSGHPDQDRRIEGASENSTNSAPAKSGAGGLLGKMKARADAMKEETLSISEWMELCKTDSNAYASFSDRLLKAIGAPEIVDTKNADQQTRLVYGGNKVARYAPFADLYDSEKAVSKLVTCIENGARIVVLRGPVGSGKTEMATILEKLTETQPMYLLKCKKTKRISPFNDTPLCLFSNDQIADEASDELKIPRRYLTQSQSAWVTKRLNFHKGDIDAAFEVVKVFPSRERQLGIAKLDPKDPKTADMDALIGSVDMTMVGEEDALYAGDPELGGTLLKEGDPDAYRPGIFSQSNGGVFHAAEFFRNNPALMNTFLEGVTTGYFTGSGGVGTLPMNQLVVITTNEPVWKAFKASNDSDAARNRIEVVDVPYTLRLSEELKIYEKLLKLGRHADKKRAPGTELMLAQFAIATRINKDGVNGRLKAYDNPFLRLRVLNGEVPDGPTNKVPKLKELRDNASPDEGLSGFTIRDAGRVLSRTFNSRATQGIQEADTILLIETLRSFINEANPEDISPADKTTYLGYIDTLAEENRKVLEKEINAAIIDADDATCQRIFDEYLEYAEAWKESKTMFTDSGEPIELAKIEQFLNAFEKRAGITNGPEFRKSAVASIDSELARIGKHNEKNPDNKKPMKVRWDSYEPVRKAISAQYEVDQDSRRQILRAKTDADLRSQEEKRQHTRFHENMAEKGYTPTMVSRMLHHLSYTSA